MENKTKFYTTIFILPINFLIKLYDKHEILLTQIPAILLCKYTSHRCKTLLILAYSVLAMAEFVMERNS